MTIDYNIDAMYEIRKHLWEELKTHKLFKASDYYIENSGTEIIPIIPVQQQPDLNQFLSGKAHIVYDKTGLSYEENWMICCEKILFTIYSTDVSEINSIRNLMLDVFRRMDLSAKDLNKSKDTDKIIFFNTMVLEITPTEPSMELDGFLSTDVILEVKYARVTDRLGRFE
jgi:hypothetical protein